MKKRKIMWFSTIITTIASVITTIFGIALTNKIMYIQKKDDDFILDRELKANRYDETWFNHCQKQYLTIDSPNNYFIKGIWLHPHDTNNTVIICHGVTENKINSIKYARMFERIGFNSIIYDHRRHGESGGKTTSYGYYEKYDLEAVVKALKSIVGDDAIIGIHGESMGAATTLLYAGTVNDQADFYIADCAFSDFETLLYSIMKSSTPLRSRVPLHLADFFMRLRDGYNFRLVTPIESVKQIKKPVLFIHSIPDSFIRADMTKEMYQAKEGPKQLKLFEKGAHAQSFNENEVEYEQVVKQFLEKHVM